LRNTIFQQQPSKSLDEKLFGLLVSSVKDYAIFMISPAGNIMSWNEGATNIKGYQANEVIGKHISLFYTPKDNEANEPMTNLSMALKHGSYESNGWRVRKNGALFWANVVFTTLFNDKGEHIGFAKVTRDTTENKIREDQAAALNTKLKGRLKLQQKEITGNELRFRKLIENSHDGISLLNEDLEVFYRSLSAERINGWNYSERNERTLAELVHPGDLQTLQDGLKVVMKNPGKPVMITFRSRHKAGTYQWLECCYTNMLTDPHIRAIVCNFKDITEKKAAEDEIQKKASEIVDVLERITDGFIALDSQMRYTYVNQQMAAMVGLSPEQMLGKYIWDLFPDAIGSKTYEAIEKAYKEQVYITNQDYYRPLNLWQENHVYPSADGLSIFIKNFTEKKAVAEHVKQQAAELKDATDNQRAILDALPPHIALLNEHGQIVTVNESWKKFTTSGGMASPNYGIGSNYFQLFVNAMGNDIKLSNEICTGIKGVIDGNREEFTKEYPYTVATGQRWYQLVAAPLSDNWRKGAVVLHTNITGRKLVEESLLRSQADLRSVFENTNLSIILLDTNLKVVSWNNNAKHLSVKVLNKKLTKGLSVFSYFPPERSQAIQQSADYASRGQMVSYEILYDFPDRPSEWFDVKWVNIVNSNNEYIGIILTLNDITERKNHEAEIKRQNKALKDVAWISSHEIRRPVASIMGLMYLLKLSHDNNEKEELINMVGECANELDKMVHDIHDKINDIQIPPSDV
jgi:PAS domain S-box-containing protein